MTRKTVLITAAGTATAVNLIKSLSTLEGLRIVTTDSNSAEMIASPSRWQTKHYQVPLASQADAFIDALADIAQREGVDAIYPVHDAEILAVAEAQSRFGTGVKLPRLSAAAVRECNDKWTNFERCRAASLPVPDSVLGSDMVGRSRAATMVRKPRRGVGSVGVRVVDPLDVLGHEDVSSDIIFQAICDKPEFTIDVLALPDYFGAVVRERLETKAGVCVKARIFFDDALHALSKKVAEAFDLSGMFCFQVMTHPEGGYCIVDINPRCGGGTALTDAAGFPIYQTYFSDLLGLPQAAELKERCQEREQRGGVALVCRYYEEVVTFESPEGARP
ncbi:MULTISPECIES: ATP-grasp domain-containing protein [unclassified Caballeronia]|uniref:ATP-grasp domain-containing protein n=1 Tax=unclassified Caballeronia TaxID=2646786 RepID=UPI002863917F|nr:MULTISPECIES: ATP-grasp domain-containing protein [unclassified Caballeronia]MDR5751444.1 ATP-grasp domain-containing protein [Caballeronia sp. LZ024]MDR5844415.1 ATP-grasp domain-containing protein [Caballeronia sp. LZ031]